jgi:hypothetical protein
MSLMNRVVRDRSSPLVHRSFRRGGRRRIQLNGFEYGMETGSIVESPSTFHIVPLIASRPSPKATSYTTG